MYKSFSSLENTIEDMETKTSILFDLQTKIKYKINLFKIQTKSTKTIKNRIPSRFKNEDIGYGHEKMGSVKSVSKNAK
jgi:hypothetical protein